VVCQSVISKPQSQSGMAQRMMAGFGIGGCYHTDTTRHDIVPGAAYSRRGRHEDIKSTVVPVSDTVCVDWSFIIFFIIVEGLVLATAKHGVSGISPLHRWSMLAVFTAPLTFGYGSALRVRSLSKNPDHS